MDLPFLEKNPDDLRNEEGIPARGGDQLGLEVFGHLCVGEDRVQVLGDGQGAQRQEGHLPQSDLVGAVLEEALHRRRRGLTAQTQGLADGAAQHEGEVASFGSSAEEEERRLVGELQVVHQEDHRPTVHRLIEHRGEGGEDPPPGLAIDVARDIHIDQAGHHMGEVGTLGVGETEEDVDSLVAPLVEEVDEDPGREVVGAASLSEITGDLGHEVRFVGLEVPLHRFEEGGLTHARGALEDQDLAPSGRHAAEGTVYNAEFVLASGDAFESEALEDSLREEAVFPKLRRQHRLVSSPVLGDVEGGVSRVDQLVRELAVFGSHGNADAQPHRDREPGVALEERPVVRALKEAGRHGERSVPTGIR